MFKHLLINNFYLFNKYLWLYMLGLVLLIFINVITQNEVVQLFTDVYLLVVMPSLAIEMISTSYATHWNSFENNFPLRKFTLVLSRYITHITLIFCSLLVWAALYAIDLREKSDFELVMALISITKMIFIIYMPLMSKLKTTTNNEILLFVVMGISMILVRILLPVLSSFFMLIPVFIACYTISIILSTIFIKQLD